jgi:hypothetical protein
MSSSTPFGERAELWRPVLRGECPVTTSPDRRWCLLLLLFSNLDPVRIYIYLSAACRCRCALHFTRFDSSTQGPSTIGARTEKILAHGTLWKIEIDIYKSM